MTVHYQGHGVTLHHGDCLDVLRELPDASVDAVVTDPPYALGFMGKAWDKFEAPGGMQSFLAGATGSARSRGYADCDTIAFQLWCTQWAAECLRVLKPGGHLLAFGGTRTWHRLACAIEDAGFEVRDSIAWMYGSGFPKSHNLAGEWAGWGTALKPAFEPVVFARKPLAGTVAANVLAHGTGALNIDGCRIEGAKASGSGQQPFSAGGVRQDNGRPAENVRAGDFDMTAGRWPANVVLDEHAAAALDAQSGERPGGNFPAALTGRSMFGLDGHAQEARSMDDTGGASRFFYTAKADATERPRVNGTAHPTVKPLDLMRWLVRLVTPPGGIVLEPFAGSGTTVEACLLEGFQCVAVEREADYLPLVVARITRQRDPVAHHHLTTGDDEPLSLFDLLEGHGE